jgi:hypothetical protein
MKKYVNIDFDDILKFVSDELSDPQEISLLKREVCFMQPLESEEIIEYMEDEMNEHERKRVIKHFTKKK